jgi:hypothetical protein
VIRSFVVGLRLATQAHGGINGCIRESSTGMI